ncbi:MAG: Mur ligase family protein [Acidimicrobiales bacterium]
MTLIAVAAGVAATGYGLLRWLRVAQREHYIAGSCLVTARRWVSTRPPNPLLLALMIVGATATVAAEALDADEVVVLVAAFLTAWIVSAFPWPLPVQGDPKLAFTRRATTLTVIAVVVTLVIAAVPTLVVGWVSGAIVAAVLTPVAVDVAAAAARPIERRNRERFRRRAEARLQQVQPFVIAITGSWGKTSTKNHVRDLVTGHAQVVASPASWNNTAGLSRTMNEHLTDGTDVLVAEMGTYGPGEIRDMCSWVTPDVAMITAIGPMHLERMGSIEGIVEAKSEILERASTAVLWVDDPRLADLAERVTVGRLLRVGTRGGDRLDVEVEQRGDDVVLWIDGEEIGSYPAAIGAHPGNVACAVAAAHAYGVPARHLAQRLGTITNPSHRAVVATNDAGVVVIDDTFNSNPSGATAALATLTASVTGRRAVVTPGMVELGPMQEQANEEFARAVADSGATLVAVGWTNRRALVRGGGPATVTVASRDAARTWVREHLAAGDGVLWENDLPDHYA